MNKVRRTLKLFFNLLLMVMPSFMKIRIYNGFMNCSIHGAAKIGFSYVEAGRIEMGEGARIGNFNFIRNVELLRIGRNSDLGSANRVGGIPMGSTLHFSNERERFPALVIGDETKVGNFHYFDCCNTIKIGSYSTIAGIHSAFFTHGISLERCRQESAPIVIGNYCRVATCSVVLKGGRLPDGSTLAANSTLHKSYDEKYMLYSGVPAKPIKAFDPSWPFFHRKQALVR